MLQITIPAREVWDHKKQIFDYTKEYTISLEHSLVAIHKWEAKWKKAFLSNSEKLPPEEFIDYVRCMTITQNVPHDAYYALTKENYQAIRSYMDDKMTATWFSKDNQKKSSKSNEVVTSELIYYWMISLHVPMECQKWHINQLLTLIHVCDVKSKPAKKKSQREILAEQARLNAQRRKALGTRG